MCSRMYLIGFMGVGKSAAASWLRRHCGMVQIETDKQIVREEGMPIAQIFAEKGEEYFRGLETGLLRRIAANELSGEDADVVISCGGGMVMRPENVELIRQSGTLVLLTARPETILHRVRNDTKRPLLQGRKSVEGIRELMEKRRPAYEAAADVIISADKKTVPQICREILQAVPEEPDR